MTTPRRSVVTVPLTTKMSEAFRKGIPVVLLPPGYEFEKLLPLLIDVTINGSEDRLFILPTTPAAEET